MKNGVDVFPMAVLVVLFLLLSFFFGLWIFRRIISKRRQSQIHPLKQKMEKLKREGKSTAEIEEWLVEELFEKPCRENFLEKRNLSEPINGIQISKSFRFFPGGSSYIRDASLKITNALKNPLTDLKAKISFEKQEGSFEMKSEVTHRHRQILSEHRKPDPFFLQGRNYDKLLFPEEIE